MNSAGFEGRILLPSVTLHAGGTIPLSQKLLAWQRDPFPPPASALALLQ